MPSESPSNSDGPALAFPFELFIGLTGRLVPSFESKVLLDVRDEEDEDPRRMYRAGGGIFFVSSSAFELRLTDTGGRLVKLSVAWNCVDQRIP